MGEMKPQTPTEARILIVGAGLAGSLLAWRLTASGARITVVDDARVGRASPVAAGLLSPLSGARLTLADRLDVHLPVARAFYQELERAMGGRWFHPMPILRDLRSAEEVQLSRQRLADRHVALYVEEDESEEASGTPFGRLRIEGGGWLDYRRLPELHRAGKWEVISQKISPEDLRETAEAISWQGRDWDACVLATGYAPEWSATSALTWQAAAGDILTARIEGWDESHIRTRGIFTVPLGENCYRVGATYERDDLSAVPKSERREALRIELHSWTGQPVEVLAHAVGVRPILSGRRLVAAPVPGHPRLFLLNGLGSKGALHAPALVENLAGQILHGHAPEPTLVHPTQTTSKPARPPRLTALAHQAVQTFCQPGDWVIDATCGLGRDTECLARAVGPSGQVATFEIQPPALEQARHRLQAADLLQPVQFFSTGHENFRQCLSLEWSGKIRAVMMNLGYLPGGNPDLHTTSANTQAFLDHVLPWMAPQALFSLLTYPGHSGGFKEYAVVAAWVNARQQEGWQVQTHQGNSPTSPVLFLLRRF
jgi:glycine/D-amino acid oxidase-like deaminating enzyme